MTGLPSTWLTTNLGAVVEYGKTKKAEPEDIDDGCWILELEDVEKDTSRLLSRVKFSARRSKSTKNRFEAGDVLYGKLRPYLNKVLVADAPGVCTTEIVPLSGGTHLNNRFLFYWLKHTVFLDYVAAASHGLNMPRLGTDTGKAAPFVLAPLPEQKRIADKLDSTLARVDACRDRLDRIPALLKRFRQSILAAATSGRLTEEWRTGRSLEATIQNTDTAPLTSGLPTGWHEASLGQLIHEMKNGLSPKPKEHPPGTRILRISAVRPGKVDFHDHRYLAVDQATRQQYGLEKDDLLFTRYNGSLEFLGVCALVSEAAPDYVYPDKLIRVRTNTDLVNPKFVELAFGSQSIRGQVEAFVKSSAGQKGISGGDLKTTRIPVPTTDEQNEIVRRVETLLAFADRLEARLATARKQVEQLTPALLAKAFRGELVPQDPNDEPASELLKHLAASREQAPTKRGRKAPSPRKQ